MNNPTENDSGDELSKKDAEFLIESLFSFFARVPPRPPLRSTLKKTEPKKLGVSAPDLAYCDQLHETVSGEISQLVGAYMAALKCAERVPEAAFFALLCLSYLAMCGPDAFDVWKREPHSKLGGISPQFWAETHDIPELNQFLF